MSAYELYLDPATGKILKRPIKGDTMPAIEKFPKHMSLRLDGNGRLVIVMDDGTTKALSEPIRFLNNEWRDEVVRRLSLFSLLQTSLASTLYIAKKFMHAKRKRDAIGTADMAALDVGLVNLRASRGHPAVVQSGSARQHGYSFIEAIDSTFKAAAVAAAATPDDEGE
jgi:hypothetical protein